jgi:hypothetical protein
MFSTIYDPIAHKKTEYGFKTVLNLCVFNIQIIDLKA